MNPPKWHIDPKCWTKLRISIEQNVDVAVGYNCPLKQTGETIHARHLLTVTSHRPRVRPNIRLHYEINAGIVGIARRDAMPQCQPDQRSDDVELRLPPTYFENSIPTILCWRPNDNEHQCNLTVEVELSTPNDNPATVREQFSLNGNTQ